MIKLGKLTDYAVVIMAQLANEEENKSCSANYLSDKTGIPEPTVAKILKKLSHGDLLKSIRGAAGGYSLNKVVGDISVADVVLVMEGGVSMVGCVGSDAKSNRRKAKRCFARDKCTTMHSWAIVNAAVVNLLKSISLTDMFAPCEFNEGEEGLIDVRDPFCNKFGCGANDTDSFVSEEEKIS